MTDSADPTKLLIEAAGSGREQEEKAINSYCSLTAPDILWLTRLLSNDPRESRLLAARTLLTLDRTTTAEESHPVIQAATTIDSTGWQSVAGIGCVFVFTIICGAILASVLEAIGLPAILSLGLLAWPFVRACRWVAVDSAPRRLAPMLLREDDGRSLAAINRLVELAVIGDRMIQDASIAALSPILKVVDEYDNSRIRHETKDRMARLAVGHGTPFEFRVGLLDCLGRIANRSYLDRLALARDNPNLELPVRDAADRAIEAIRSRDSTESLLRPAAVPGDLGLLRPAGDTASETNSLLRSSAAGAEHTNP